MYYTWAFKQLSRTYFLQKYANEEKSAKLVSFQIDYGLMTKT